MGKFLFAYLPREPRRGTTRRLSAEHRESTPVDEGARDTVTTQTSAAATASSDTAAKPTT